MVFIQTQQRFHREHPDAPAEQLDRAMLAFPCAEVRYAKALDVIAGLRRAGPVVVLSDGDPTSQPLKIARAGVAEAVDGDVLVFGHKGQHLEEVALLFPADRYIAIDDKAGVLPSSWPGAGVWARCTSGRGSTLTIPTTVRVRTR